MPNRLSLALLGLGALCGLALAESSFSLEEAALRTGAESVPTPAAALFGALAAIAGLATTWWFGQRKAERQRFAMRRLYRLGEQMTSSRSLSENLRMLQAVLPEALRVTGVRLYLYDRASKTLRRVEEDAAPELVPILTDDPVGFLEKALASCYRNRSLLAIPDNRQSPFFQAGDAAIALPRAAMLVPMFAQGDLIGILEIDNANKVRQFGHDEQAVAQHLGNQIAIGVRLLERQSLREQPFRSEELATTGRLVSSVVGELQAPMEAIAGAAEALLEGDKTELAEPELHTISSEVRRASKVVAWLLSLAKMEREEIALVDLTSLLTTLLRLREPAWRERGIQLHKLLPPDPLFVEGSKSQLEQTFLSLLIHAEQFVADRAEKRISIRAGRLAANAEVEMTCSGAPVSQSTDPLGEAGDAEGGKLSLDVCRAIVQSHRGDLQLVAAPGQVWRLDLKLPLAACPEATAPVARPAVKTFRRLTTLLVEPEAAAQRSLVTQLGERNHRSVPAAGAEEAADLAGRLHFDVVFCSARLPDLDWIEFFERIRAKTEAFVLLTEGYQGDSPITFQSGDGYTLNKPVKPDELGRVLGRIESRLAAASR